jgi:hypothetical protein
LAETRTFACNKGMQTAKKSSTTDESDFRQSEALIICVWWYAGCMESATPGRVVWLLIKWTFLLTGPLFLGGALISAHHTQQFLLRSVTVQGRVVGLKPVRGGQHNTLTYAPVFRFDVPGTHFATVVSHTSSSPPVFKVGEMVTVHYEQGHPEGAVIDSFGQLWLGDVVFGGVGALFTCISLLIVVYVRKGKRRNLGMSGDGSGITRL